MRRFAPPSSLAEDLRRGLRVMLVAKHALGDGAPHPEDGTHAVYHREMRRALEDSGVPLLVADGYEALFDRPPVDFVFPLLNRGGFTNSEMMLPLLCERLGLPYLGASPILRGLADDKHLSKRMATAHGLATAPWAVFRRGAPVDAALRPRAARCVVKPNASSASWGISDAFDPAGVADAVAALHAQGHDAIVEPFIAGHDIEVSVVTLGGEPFILPTQIVEQDDPEALRLYVEKRNLVVGQSYSIAPLHDARLAAAVEAATHTLIREFLPFDYGRFEFRLDAATGTPLFMEVNLNCNLWSQKTIAIAAGQIGWSHRELVESILAESLSRQKLRPGALHLAA